MTYTKPYLNSRYYSLIYITIIFAGAVLCFGCVTDLGESKETEAVKTLDVQAESNESVTTMPEEVIESETTAEEAVGSESSTSGVPKSDPASTKGTESAVEFPVPKFRVKSERVFWPSRNVETNTVYEYSRSNFLTKTITTDSAGKIIVSKEYVYSSSNLVQEITRNDQNLLVSNHDYAYDDRGRLTSDNYSDSRGRIQSIIRYEYNDRDFLSKLSVFSGQGELIAYEKHEYEHGKLSQKQTFDKRNSLLHSIEYKYDTDNKLISEFDYLMSGQLEKVTVYLYDAKGNLIELQAKNSQGKLLSKQIYNYTDFNNIHSITYYSSEELIDRYVYYTYEHER